MRGRKRKPTAVHRQNGNPSKIDLKERERNEPRPPKPVAINKLPRPPKFFDKTAKAEWKRCLPVLYEMELYTDADLAIFQSYCMAYSQMIKTGKFLAELKDAQPVYKTASGALVQYPQVSMFNKSFEKVKGACAELGFTPSARGRLNVPTESGPGQPDPAYGMERLLASRKANTKRKLTKLKEKKR